MSRFYLTTAIAYTNAKPHAGFAMELIQADCMVRYRRLMGDETYFLTGTDEHGMKIAQTARDQNMTPQELADMNSASYRDLTSVLNISNDAFIRTTDAAHIKGAQKLWTMLEAADALYKKVYEGLYCVGCEAYITEKELVDGKCAIHLKAPVAFKEENYFFRYSRYLPQIKELIENDTLKIIPTSRKNEMLGLIDASIAEGRDVSFSRPVASLSWGIPVPSDPTQAMYVWCDALSNYITALDFENNGELFQKFWPANAHLIGKDILRFHGGFWIAMLLAAKLPIPKALYVHGYITSEGHKMSKSLGNVVDPFEATKRFGVDPLRYYLLREIPTTDDGDFSATRFEAVYSGELGNNLGNLVNRVTAMTEKYAQGKVPAVAKDDAVLSELLKTWKEYQSHMDNFNLKAAIERTFEFFTFMNQQVNDKKPWELAKTEPSEVLKLLYIWLELLRHGSMMISPFMPTIAAKIQEGLGCDGSKLYPDNIGWGVLKEGTTLKKIEVLFPKEIPAN